jgi:hypothetical protein
LNEVDSLSQRLDFVPHATTPLLWDGKVPSDRELRGKSQPLLEDAPLKLLVINALRISHEFIDLICEGYSQDWFHYGDEGEWRKDSRIEAIVGCFSRLNRLCIPRNSELRLRLITELHDSSSAGHKKDGSTLAKALDIFWWKRIRQYVKGFVSAASYVDEQRFNHILLRLFTHCMFHLDRGT